MRLTGRGLPVLSLLSVALGGCGAGYTVESTPTVVELVGHLESGRVGEWDCVWVTDATGARFDVAFPNGWHAFGRPVRLVDAAGALIAREGDLLAMRGPEVTGESVCAPDVFQPTSVTRR